ncbi:MAG TPA: L-glutamate gamma-semialdehyde dehydrogenase [Mycobacteriales bacterium]|nr:L-glutamate gamma-semialdehyde dehydrogenase [Mycobacteriales bacterium]
MTVELPANEAVREYAPGSPERAALEAALARLADDGPVDLSLTIAGKQRRGAGETIDVVQPHRHAAPLGRTWQATPGEVAEAVDAALTAGEEWRRRSLDERATVFLKAADLLAGSWRDVLNAATMLGQSKTCYQAEIDSACELIDFWRFNVAFARQIDAEQPLSTPVAANRFDHRPLEGFVLAITPFNFSAIAGNLPTAPALMGVPVVWKPSPTQALAAHHTMRLLEAAGLPPGVINLVTGDGAAVSEVAVVDPRLSGIHFTGSTPTFRHLWRTVADNLDRYRDFPRLVGETGGKDFVVAHPSADVDALRVGLVRGAFEYQGQKCSAASRAFIARSVWERLRDDLADTVRDIPMGDPTDFSMFMGAVIDRRAYERITAAIGRARADASISVLAGGAADDSVGYFVKPTVLVGADPTHEVFTTELFGPVLAVHVYDDGDYEATLRHIDRATPFGLTGAVFATDAAAIEVAHDLLRYAAGNFYVNDKPTGAVVGQQPFGGARGSGTNDKAGSAYNLLRWTSPRVVKETHNPTAEWRYPHMG